MTRYLAIIGLGALVGTWCALVLLAGVITSPWRVTNGRSFREQMATAVLLYGWVAFAITIGPFVLFVMPRPLAI